MAITLLICYDIGDDDRRDDVSTLLETLGPRVQMSVFECTVTDRPALHRLLGELAGLIEPAQDQVRVYNLGQRPASPTIVGTRTLEESRDFWVM